MKTLTNTTQLSKSLGLNQSWKWLKVFLEKEKYLPQLEVSCMDFQYGTAFEVLLAKSIHATSLGERSDRERLEGVSFGGTCRMLQTSDGYLALNLARQSDYELLPAWLEEPLVLGKLSEVGVSQGAEVWERLIWERLSRILENRSAKELVERAEELGLAASLVAKEGLTEKDILPAEEVNVSNEPSQKLSPSQEIFEDVRVVDISTLLAGPLVGKLLADSGAEVIKLESLSRPDGLRGGAQEFYEYLNGQKIQTDIDLGTELRGYLESADVVIESSRPRAMSQLGIDPEDFVNRGALWISITGHGRNTNRVAFGDDAAVAGGLFWQEELEAPQFIGDAIADPITGVDGYIAAVDCLKNGKVELLDMNMVGRVENLISESRNL